MASNIDNDPIAQPVRTLVELFGAHLADVQFPGVDHQVLASLTTRVDDSATQLQQAKAQVQAAEEALGAARAQLYIKAEQALAYARIYAANDPSLLARLNDVSLAKLGKPTAKADGPKTKKAESDAGIMRKKTKKVEMPAETEASPQAQAD